MSLMFDETEVWVSKRRAKETKVAAHTRRSSRLEEVLPDNVPVEENGRLELSNNRAERGVKPFVMGRKNWLFANTEGGAQSSAMIYGLIETAKENGLDPYRYLTWVLTKEPILVAEDKEWTAQLLPSNAPASCRTILKEH